MRSNIVTVFWMIIPLLVLAGSCSTPETQDRAFLNDRSYAVSSDDVLSAEDALKKHVLAKRLADNPEIIEKLTARDIKLVLGKPLLERLEGSNTALQYQSGYCVLDLYFSSSAAQETDTFTPSYIDMKPARSFSAPQSSDVQTVDIDSAQCLKSVL